MRTGPTGKRWTRSYLRGMNRRTVLSALLAAPFSSPALAGVLDSVRGDKRFILMFAKSRSDAALDKQLGLFIERRPEMEARNAVVLLTTENRDTMTAVGYASIPAGTGRRLYREFDPPERGLTVILLGPDRQEQMRWRGVVEPDVIFDAMDDLPTAREPDSGEAGG